MKEPLNIIGRLELLAEFILFNLYKNFKVLRVRR